MGRRGRPPKPTVLKILTGNPGQRPLNLDEPQPDKTPPKCPTWMDTEAKKKWRELAPELSRLGLLTRVDGGALSCLCQAWSEYRQATETLQRDGRYLTNRETGTVKSHPAVAQQRSAWAAYQRYCGLFGLDPSSRVRLKCPGQERPADEFEDFLNKKEA